MLFNKTGQLIIMVSLFMLQYFAEHIFPETKKNNTPKNEWKNLQWGLLGWGLNILPAIGLAKWLQYINFQKLGFLGYIHLNSITGLIVFFLLIDLWMYWWHRMNHTIKLFWQFHRLHHTEEHMNTTTVLRFHFAELFISNCFKALIFLMLGPMVFMVMLYEIVFLTNVLFHHSNIKMSLAADNVYSKFFSSPLMHRLHHSKKMIDRNTNYGSVFSCWDKLFGSYKKNEQTQIAFGLEDDIRNAKAGVMPAGTAIKNG